MSNKERVVWIDTAKGVCIMLVVLQHTSNFLNCSYPCQSDFSTFRMPLYFILSGLFFKTYENFYGFIKRKTNKLVIPYVFFFVFGGVVIPILFSHLFNIRIWSYKDYGFEALSLVFSEKYICNPSIWFLICLFEVNVVFYLVSKFARKVNNLITYECIKEEHWIIILSMISGIIGILFSLYSINVPYFMDSAFTTVPFFCFGWCLRNYTNILYFDNTRRNNILTLIYVCATFFVVHFFKFGYVSIMTNDYGGLLGVFQLYPYGILGTLCVLLMSKLLGKIAVVSFVGRYSIIVLCIHAYTIQLAAYLSSTINFKNLASVFIIAVLLNVFLIPVFRKYLGIFTAQKDLIKI